MSRKLKRIAQMIAATFALCAASASHAGLILTAPVDFEGTGLGSVNTILTIQGKGNATTEAGGVSYSAGGDVRTGDAKTGASQTQTRTMGSLGLTSADNLRVVFNALEPGNTANSISLTDLVLRIYSPTGAVLFTSGAFGGQAFADTQTGAGNSGFLFRLDAADSLAAQAAAFGSGFANNRVGLSAAAANATGGFETFFVANVGGTVTPPDNPPPTGNVPEPGSVALLGIGMLAALRARRRGKAVLPA